MPYFMRKERDKYCIFKGTSNDPGDLVKCHESEDDASAHMRALMANVDDSKPVGDRKSITSPVATADWESMTAEEIMAAKGKDIESTGGEPAIQKPFVDPVTPDEQTKEIDIPDIPATPGDQFITYKSGDTYRWLAIANVAMWDREDERLTDKAYDDAVTIGGQLGYGELDLVHVDGTDVGDCDLMLRMGAGEEARLIQGGTWYNDPQSTNSRKSVQADPDYWGTSIKFVYDPAQFTEGVYHGGIRVKKCTILPRSMAASHGTAIAVLGGEQKMKELDKETRDALAKLGVEESTIEELAERSKSLPDEDNIKTKEDESPTMLDQIKAILANAFGNKAPEQAAQPDVEKENEVAPVSIQETEVVKEVVEDETEPVESTATSEETVKVIAMTVAQSLAPSIQQAMQPLTDSLTAIQSWQASIEKRLLETEKDIETKVTEKLDSQPPIVKVQPSTLKQNEIDSPSATLLDSPADATKAEFVKAVTDIVSGALKSQFSLPDIKLSK